MGKEVRERVKERYAGAARTVLEGTGRGLVLGSAGERGLDSEALGVDWTGRGYSAPELEVLPEAAGAASLGCAQPHRPRHALPWRGRAGSGQRRWHRRPALGQEGVPDGKAYGLDMTDEMRELAEKNWAEAGAKNVEFLKGNIEDIPLPENHVDVVISNCVINLSTDKPTVHLRGVSRFLSRAAASPSRTWCSWATRASFRPRWWRA